MASGIHGKRDRCSAASHNTSAAAKLARRRVDAVSRNGIFIPVRDDCELRHKSWLRNWLRRWLWSRHLPTVTATRQEQQRSGKSEQCSKHNNDDFLITLISPVSSNREVPDASVLNIDN